jgi:prepilin-type N-terminal cleavage/methylation domain-containing protein
MSAIARSQRGFSLVELMMVVAVAGTLMAISVPSLLDMAERSKLNAATREVERELQSARLRAVSTNRSLRVHLNCPTTGYFRTVEVLNTSADSSTNRCLLSAYSYPAPDDDLATRPNHDGPLRLLTGDATVSSGVFEFRPDGRAYIVSAGTPQLIATAETVTVTRREQSRTVSINGAGRVQIQ